MIIWLALLIPVITILLLYIVPEFRKRVAWWECILKLLIVLGFIGGMQACTELSVTNDTERYMDYVISVEHHTYWNEWISETCTRECCCSTDSKGNRSCGTESYDCSYEEDYSPYTIVTTKLGKRFTFYEGFTPHGGSSPTKFIELNKKFHTSPRFIKTHNRDINTRYDSRSVPDIDKRFIGNIFKIEWSGKVEDVEYTTWNHTYENRVQASHSIDSYLPVDTSDIREYGLFEYPEIYNSYKSDAILGYKSSTNLDEYVNQKNSLIASEKQLKVYYVFFKNKSRNAGLLQQQHWMGGNKNEVVICIGLDKTNNVTWSHVFSWSKKQDFVVNIRDYNVGKKVFNEKTFREMIDYSFEELYIHFERREFAEFSYLTVEPPMWGIITTYILTLIICVGFSVWIVTNEFDLQ